jgi:hypothetical protein
MPEPDWSPTEDDPVNRTGRNGSAAWSQRSRRQIAVAGDRRRPAASSTTETVMGSPPDRPAPDPKESISALRTILTIIDPNAQPHAFRHLRDRLDDSIARKIESSHPGARIPPDRRDKSYEQDASRSSDSSGP